MEHIKEFNEFINEATILRGSRAAIDDILKQRKVVQYLSNNPEENEVVKKAYGTLASLYDKQAQSVWRDMDSKINVLANRSFDDAKAAQWDADTHAGILRFLSAVDSFQTKLNKIVTKYSGSQILPILTLAAEGGGASDIIGFVEYSLNKDLNARKPELIGALNNTLDSAKQIIKTNKDRLNTINRELDGRIDSL